MEKLDEELRASAQHQEEGMPVNHASYDDIAEWYDSYLRENPIYHEIVLPNLLELAGEMDGQTICDLACGQGWIARALARRGAQVTGVDLAEQLLVLARRYEEREPLGIEYLQDDAQRAQTLTEASFDGTTCILALMTIPDLEAVFRTVRRILKPGGWFVFAITHPCFETPHAGWLRTDEGTVVRTVGGYFHERFWTSCNPGGVRGRVGEHHRMLSTYLNTLIATGFALEHMREPAARGKRAEQVPGEREVPSLLVLRAHKKG
jgi:ubiquinone/menaquinone biosynthesis C-methylase UbiE